MTGSVGLAGRAYRPAQHDDAECHHPHLRDYGCQHAVVLSTPKIATPTNALAAPARPSCQAAVFGWPRRCSRARVPVAPARQRARSRSSGQTCSWLHDCPQDRDHPCVSDRFGGLDGDHGGCHEPLLGHQPRTSPGLNSYHTTCDLWRASAQIHARRRLARAGCRVADCRVAECSITPMVPDGHCQYGA